MSKGMFKTTIREIRGSLGRYMAILAIVMLGVGLFTGLKATTPAMIITENEYLAEQDFLISGCFPPLALIPQMWRN